MEPQINNNNEDIVSDEDAFNNEDVDNNKDIVSDEGIDNNEDVDSKKPSKEVSHFARIAILISIIICLMLELFVFNIRYIAFNLGGYETIDITKTFDENIERSNIENTENGILVLDDGGSVRINNLNKKITNVYVGVMPSDRNPKGCEVNISYGDEESSNRWTRTLEILRNIDKTKYIHTQTYGEVSYLKINLNKGFEGVMLDSVVINKPVPFEFNIQRFILYFILINIIIFSVRYKVFSRPIREESFKQRLIFSVVSAGVVLNLFAMTVVSSPNLFNFKNDGDDRQYSKDIVDTILDKRLHLDIEPSEKLKSLDNPQDPHLRSNEDVYFEGWDLAYHDGKFYNYFGIVQVLVLSLPFKVITGEYISTRLSVFIFTAIASMFMMLIYRKLALKFMKNMSVGMFTLGQIAIVLCSMLSYLVARPKFYEVAVASALCFTFTGLFFILLSVIDKKRTDAVRFPQLFFGCLCMALAVGCRPNFVFASLLVPVILFDEIRREVKNLKNNKKGVARLVATFLSVFAPYLAVALPLMWYNYARFGSIVDFGNSYMMTVTNVGSSFSLDILNRFILIGVCILCVFLPDLKLSAGFPFVKIDNLDMSGVYDGYIYREHTLGMLSLPFMWLIAAIPSVCKYNRNYEKKRTLRLMEMSGESITIKAKPTALGVKEIKTTYIDESHRMISRLVVTLPIIGILYIVVMSFIGLATRYEVDFVWLFVLAALICCYFVTEMAEKSCAPNAAKIISRLINLGIIISIIMMFLFTLESSDGNNFMNHNPEIFYNLKTTLGF